MKSIYRFFDGIAQHSQGFIVILLILFAIAAAIGFEINRRDVKMSAGRNALFAAERTLETELKALSLQMKPPVPAVAKPGDKTPPKAPEGDPDAIEYSTLDVDAKFGAAVKQFRAVIADYAGTRVGLDAELELGQLYYEHGQADKATALFKQATLDASGTMERALAFSSLGYSQENGGKYTDAIQTYEKALDMGEGSLKGDLLMAIARCQEAVKDTAKARGTYDRIIQQLPNTEYAKNATLNKSLLE